MVNIVKKHKKYILLFTIIFFVGILISLSWIWIFHFSLYKNGDDIVQHYRVLLYLHDWYREVFKNIFVKHILSIPMFEYTLGYGSDIISTFSYYGIADPFYILAAVTPKVYMEFLFWGLIVIRLYLAGLFFSLYALKKGNGYRETGLGALVYCFCSFTLTAGFLQLPFVNALMYLPILLIGAENIFEENNGKTFIVGLFLLLSSSFYWCYMTVIVVVLFCFVYYFEHYQFKITHFLLNVCKFLFCGCIGVALSGWIIYPAYKCMIQSERLSTHIEVPVVYDIKYYFHLLSHFFTDEKDFSTYLGFVPIALTAVFVLFIKVGGREKGIKFLFIFSSIFLLIPYFGHAFNGFGYVSNRWTFAYSFLIAYIVTITYPNLISLSEKEKLRLFVCTGIWSLISVTNRYSRTEWSMTMLVICLMFTMLVILANELDRKKFYIFTWIIAMGSIAMNVTYLYSYSEGVELSSQRLKLGDAYEYAVENSPVVSIKEVNGQELGRSDSANVMGIISDSNQFFSQHLGSGNFYFSTGNSVVGEFNKQMGILTPMTYAYNGLDGRSILETLSGVKYYLIKKGEESYLPFGFDKCIVSREVQGVTYDVYKNQYDLPLAYSYEDVWDWDDWNGRNSIDKQEALLSGIVIEGVESTKKIQTTNIKIPYTVDCSGGIIMDGNTIKVNEPNAYITLNFAGICDSETYVEIKDIDYTQNTDISDGDGSLYEKYKNKIDRKNLEKNKKIDIFVTSETGTKRTISYYTPQCEFYCGVHMFCACLGYSENGMNKCTLMFPSIGTYSIKGLSVYCQPMNIYRESISHLQKSGMKDIKLNENVLTADSDMNIDSYACIALPYSEGWSAWVDGIPQPINKCNGMYMAIYLKAGKHSIVMKYRTPGIVQGLVVSCVGVLLFLGIIIWEAYKNRRCTKNK